tara:strand:+ start:1212 stop:1379 length:168 start_codon:yes stop_codon:yes gene_type:complete
MGAGGFGEENFEGVDSSRCSRCEAMFGEDFFLAWRLMLEESKSSYVYFQTVNAIF